MSLYIISYDLHFRRDYTRLYEYLLGWNAKRLLESVWLANVDGSASAVRDTLLQHMDGDDSVAVIELNAGSDWSCMRAKPEGVEWLRQFVRR